LRGAALWQSGKTTLLASGGIAYGVNDSGQVVGSTQGPNHATLWINGTATDLGTLGGANSDARAINSLGQIVGSSNTTGGTDAFIYLNGSMIDLNKQIFDPNWQLISATGINDAGQIIGTGTHLGLARAFLLTPFTSIAPNHGGNAGSVTATIPSLGIQAGTTAKLTATGQPDIVGSNPTITNNLFLQTTFDLIGATPGTRQVVLILPGGSTVNLPGSFTIEEGGSAQAWVDVLGRTAIEAGVASTYTILYGNRGNIDVNGLLGVSVAFSTFLNYTLGAGGAPATAFNADNGETVLSFDYVQVPAGSTAAILLTVTPPSTVAAHAPFHVRAWALQTCSPGCP
jgi:probable HAF family extracellular repeat protein